MSFDQGPAQGREDIVVRNVMMPVNRNGFCIEPTIDRFFARAFDVPVWSAGRAMC